MSKSNLFFILGITYILNSCTLKHNKLECESFKIGHFKMHSEIDNSESIIERNDSIQTETNTTTGHIVKSRITWKTSCDYELVYLSQTTIPNDTVAHYFQTHPLKTSIIQTGKNYYIFRSTVEGADVTLVDTLRTIRSQF